jgi:hypothetical protein
LVSQQSQFVTKDLPKSPIGSIELFDSRLVDKDLARVRQIRPILAYFVMQPSQCLGAQYGLSLWQRQPFRFLIHDRQ